MSHLVAGVAIMRQEGVRFISPFVKPVWGCSKYYPSLGRGPFAKLVWGCSGASFGSFDIGLE